MPAQDKPSRRRPPGWREVRAPGTDVTHKTDYCADLCDPEARAVLSSSPIEVPAALMSRATGRAPARTLIAGADTAVALESAKAATEAGLIDPVLIGDPGKIRQGAVEIGWDVSPFDVIEGIGDAGIADAAAVAVADPAVQIVMKGHVHTDALMAAMLRKEAGVRIGRRLSHVFHMTVPGSDRPLLISDGALNVAPNDKTLQAIVENLVGLSHAIGLERPRIAVLSATEERVETMPSSVQAGALVDWARTQDFAADIEGPFAFDNAVSPNAAEIKGLTGNPVAGQADSVIVPTIEVGNALFKMMVYFMSACAAGVVIGGRVPIVITSRADPPVARLASTALATLAMDA